MCVNISKIPKYVTVMCYMHMSRNVDDYVLYIVARDSGREGVRQRGYSGETSLQLAEGPRRHHPRLSFRV